MTHELPAWLLELLGSAPRAGEGVHSWLFRCARQLHAHLPAGEILALLRRQVANCGRAVSDSEILSAVQNSLNCAWQPQDGCAPVKTATMPKWPSVNQRQRAAIIKEGGGLADLWELSPIPIDDNEAHTEDIVDRLFPGNPLLCCGESKFSFDTRPRKDWSGQLSKLQLIVPSPMSKIGGLTKESRESRHCLDNTGPRRFLICEFDRGDVDQHSALLIHLAQYAPLVCVVHSGGKSLHGWFYVENKPDQKVHKFFRYAVSLGADAATWTRSQFVRMPDGMRDTGKRQTVFFLSCKPLEINQ